MHTQEDGDFSAWVRTSPSPPQRHGHLGAPWKASGQVAWGPRGCHLRSRVQVSGTYRDWVWRARWGVVLRASTLLRLERTTSTTKLVQSVQTSFRTQPWVYMCGNSSSTLRHWGPCRDLGRERAVRGPCQSLHGTPPTACSRQSRAHPQKLFLGSDHSAPVFQTSCLGFPLAWGAPANSPHPTPSSCITVNARPPQ